MSDNDTPVIVTNQPEVGAIRRLFADAVHYMLDHKAQRYHLTPISNRLELWDLAAGPDPGRLGWVQFEPWPLRPGELLVYGCREEVWRPEFAGPDGTMDVMRLPTTIVVPLTGPPGPAACFLLELIGRDRARQAVAFAERRR